jgi:hypothetical protein
MEPIEVIEPPSDPLLPDESLPPESPPEEPLDPSELVDDSPSPDPPVHPARPPSVTADPPMAVFFRKRRLDWLLLSRTMFATP